MYPNLTAVRGDNLATLWVRVDLNHSAGVPPASSFSMQSDVSICPILARSVAACVVIVTRRDRRDTKEARCTVGVMAEHVTALTVQGECDAYLRTGSVNGLFWVSTC